MSKVEFYHYTSKEGKNAILSSGVIRSSRGQGGQRDAVFGDGVYGTCLDPHNFSKTQLAMNNYDSSSRCWRSFLQQGKLDYAFKLWLPKSQVEVVQNTNRYVLLHDGDVYLDEVNFKVVRVPSSSSAAGMESESESESDTDSESESDTDSESESDTDSESESESESDTD